MMKPSIFDDIMLRFAFLLLATASAVTIDDFGAIEGDAVWRCGVRDHAREISRW